MVDHINQGPCNYSEKIHDPKPLNLSDISLISMIFWWSCLSLFPMRRQKWKTYLVLALNFPLDVYLLGVFSIGPLICLDRMPLGHA